MNSKRSGRLTAELARRVGPKGRVVGLDFSAGMLEVARRDYPNLEFIEGDALKLPFDDASFDASTIVLRRSTSSRVASDSITRCSFPECSPKLKLRPEMNR